MSLLMLANYCLLCGIEYHEKTHDEKTQVFLKNLCKYTCL